MTPADPRESTQRDRMLARMLAEAFDRQRGTPSGGYGSDCPTPQTLAAYADQGLVPGEAARWEEHFAGCHRCQKIIAVLTVSEAEPLKKDEVERLGQLISSVSAPARTAEERPVRTRRAWQPLRLRWLVPVMGTAALVMWFAVRPMIQNEPAVEIAADYSASRQAPTEGTSGLTQAASEPPAAGLQSDSAEAAPAASESAAAASSAAPAESIQALAAETARENTAQNAAQPAAPQAPSASVAEAERAIAPRRDQAPAARTGMQAMAMRVAAQPGFASPDGSVQWRLGPGGRIERSTDQGASWQAQPSSVTAELTAGAAPSSQNAWVVGRAGVILRTTNGLDWQRVASPSSLETGPAPDWIAVEAQDALRATVTSQDGRRFATTDGGRTWSPQ